MPLGLFSLSLGFNPLGHTITVRWEFIHYLRGMYPSRDGISAPCDIDTLLLGLDSVSAVLLELAGRMDSSEGR